MQALYHAEQYRTSVTIHVVCNEAAALRHVLHTWERAVTVHQSQNLDNDTNTYNILWEHREIMQTAAMSGIFLHALYTRGQRHGTLCYERGSEK